MSQNQFIAVGAALIILFAVFVWAASRRGGQEALPLVVHIDDFNLIAQRMGGQA